MLEDLKKCSKCKNYLDKSNFHKGQYSCKQCFSKRQQIYQEQKRQAKEWPIKECKSCKKSFRPYNNSQNYCKNPCTSKPRLTIEEANKAWVLRSEADSKRKNKYRKDHFFDCGQMRII